MQHVLVTGGTGLIGRAVVAALLGATGPTQITVLTRQRNPALPAGVQAVQELAMLSSLPPVTAVINLAGAPLADRRWTKRRLAEFRRSRIDLTNQLVSTLSARQAPAVLVSGSAVGWYGPRLDDTVLDEGSTALPDSFSHRLCADWEAAALAAGQHGTRVVLLRTGIVMANNGGMLQRLLPLFRLGLGGPVGNGRQWLSWIHLTDIVAAVQQLLADPQAAGVYNATAPEPVTNAVFTSTLGATVNRPAALRAPSVALRLVYGDMADELLLAGQRVLPTRLLAAGFRFQFPTLADALADLAAAQAA